LPAAGLPWFMALFGRDSLITSFQALPYLPELAATTLRVLAARQAQARDDFHEMEPGKILHELRFGELTATGRQPHSPYFGSADATPLFVILLDEYHRWTGDDGLVRRLEPNARAALAWTEDGGDLDGDGYVEYSRRNQINGLVNQCWKDSGESIQFADGTLARGPIATCEIQGYVFDARRRGARLAREVWFEYRLPEVFAGYPAELTSVPVVYPSASRPQAWAAGTPLLLLTALLKLEPATSSASVAIPGSIGAVALHRKPTPTGAPPATSPNGVPLQRKPVPNSAGAS
jgi:glycogen debranching enzyme